MQKLIKLFITLLLAGTFFAGGCSGEDTSAAIAKKGDLVKVDYTGRLADGTLFDSSTGRNPLEFTVGSGQMIEGFDAAIPGMRVGETRTVTIPAEKAYGAYRPELVINIPISSLPSSIKPVVGQELPLSNGMRVKITAVNDTEVTLDGNHALAGKDLTFVITLIAIEK